MKLEGSLDAFGLPDIFQLLSFTKKSGGLHLRGDAGEGVVYFTGGSVTGASADGGRQVLARRLVGSGVVDDATLEAAVDRARSEGIGVGRALLESEQVPGDVLEDAATEQAVDAVFDLLRWSEGDFSFSMDEPNPDDVGVALPTERVVAEAGARAEAWQGVAEVVPSPELVPTLPVVLPDDPVVTRDEWALLALVDGRRRVGDLVELTGAGQFAVASTLAALAARGLVQLEPDAEDHVSRVRRRFDLLGALETTAPAPAAPASPTAPAGPVAPSAVRTPTSAVPVDIIVSAPEDEPEDEPENEPAEESAELTAVVDAPPVAVAPVAARPVTVPPATSPATAYAGQTGGPAVLSTTPGSASAAAVGVTMGSAAVAADPQASSLIDRDPSINRSLLLRLIAGVRGL
ncbi:MAG: DUF4388 domain-containing protein [Actinomycetia bacterium]|nr:DUF4388 domain-containing protein [Actinomycetes bacterium]